MYKVIHIAAAMSLFLAFGGAIASKGGAKTRVLSTHGTALVILLITGFGLMAKLGIGHGGGFPTWIVLKGLLWIVLGGAIAIAKRGGVTGVAAWWSLPALGALAAYLAIFKP